VKLLHVDPSALVVGAMVASVMLIARLLSSVRGQHIPNVRVRFCEKS
jgi:hypothetical protein